MEELEQACQDAERRAQQVCPVFADGLSTQPYATPVEKKTFQSVAAVAHVAPVQGHSPTLSLGALAGNINLKARNKGSSAKAVYIDDCELKPHLQLYNGLGGEYVQEVRLPSLNPQGSGGDLGRHRQANFFLLASFFPISTLASSCWKCLSAVASYASCRSFVNATTS